MEDAVVVQTDGTKLVVHQRTDLGAGSERARKLAIYSNRVGEVNLDWDAGALSNWNNVDLRDFWNGDELRKLGAGGGGGDGEDESERCPTCGKPWSKKLLLYDLGARRWAVLGLGRMVRPPG